MFREESDKSSPIESGSSLTFVYWSSKTFNSFHLCRFSGILYKLGLEARCKVSIFPQFSRDCGIYFNAEFYLNMTVLSFWQSPIISGNFTFVFLIYRFSRDSNSDISSGSSASKLISFK